MYVQAVKEAFPLAKVRVFVKNDDATEDDPLRQMGVVFHSVWHFSPWLRTPMLVLQGLGAGLWERPACVVATHLHFLPPLVWLKWLRRVPVGGVLHGIEAWALQGGARVWALKNASHLLAVSRHTRQVVIDAYGLDPAKVSVVPNTFDTERFTPGPKPEHLLRRYGLRPENRVLLTVSRLALTERYKGHRQVLQALGTVRERFPEVRYLIVGTGDDLPPLRETVAALNLQGQVILAGHVAGEELADHYRLCDVFVMPSSREGFGIVFLEAMACGKPVVAGNVDGSVDALDDGRLGRLVNPDHPSGIAEAICQILAPEQPDALWNDPVALHAAVVAQFGYPRVSRLLAHDLALLLGRGGLSRHGMAPAATGAQRGPRRIVVLTQYTSPYQVEFFNAMAAGGGCQLLVIYLTSEDRARQWATPHISHEHLILSETPRSRKEALAALLEADLTVFNYYTDWFALRTIRQRSRNGQPWVFWGERPGFLQTGMLGVLARWLLLKPLHQHPVPIWGVGRFGVEGYQREFGHDRRYENIPYFSNLERFTCIERSSAAPRAFLYSGTLTHRKGADVLATAFARVAARHSEARLFLLGAGEMEADMKERLRACAHQVTWLGFQPWEKLPECYAQGSVFCFPSRYDGWGLALVEALASGMPSIGTSRTGSAVEFLSDGTAGWIVEPGSARHLEEAMEAALAMPGERFGQMQQAARAKVGENGLQEGVERFLRAAAAAVDQQNSPAAAAALLK